MDSVEVRKLRAVERIKKILDEEKCVLQTKIVIVGKTIVDDQVVVVPFEIEETVIEKSKEGGDDLSQG